MREEKGASASTEAKDDEEALAAEVAHLKEQLETRKAVDHAKGLLMEEGFSEQDAFSRLQKTSMNTRLPLRVVAEAVLLANQVRR